MSTEEPTQTTTEQAEPQADAAAAASSVVAGLRARAEQMLAARARVRVREPAPEPSKAAPTQKTTQRAKADTPATGVDAETRQLADELREALNRLNQRESQQATSERIAYARKAGLRGDVSDEVAASLVGRFDVSTAEGRNKFEAFRKANAGLFIARETPEQRQNALAERYKAQTQGKTANKRFGEDFAKRQIAKNFGGKR